MGTYITPGATRKETVAEILSDYKPSDHATVGRCLWMVVTVKPDQREPYPIIALCLLTSSGDGYKPMDETMGPYFHNCPLRLLEAVPDPQEGYSTGWRERVRKFHDGAREIDLLPGVMGGPR